jgi:hypothetical protein
MSESYRNIVVMSHLHSYWPVFPRIRQIKSRWYLTLERLSTGRYEILLPLDSAAHTRRITAAIEARPDAFRCWVDNGCPK